MNDAAFLDRVNEFKLKTKEGAVYIKGAFGEYVVKGIRIVPPTTDQKVELFCISTIEIPRMVYANIDELYFKV